MEKRYLHEFSRSGLRRMARGLHINAPSQIKQLLERAHQTYLDYYSEDENDISQRYESYCKMIDLLKGVDIVIWDCWKDDDYIMGRIEKWGKKL